MRTLDEINFFENGEQVRNIFRRAGILTDTQIVALGCTGLALRLRASSQHERAEKFALADAKVVRQNMGGSICGLPCYVPPTRFCLIHNTIGGLQLTNNVDSKPQEGKFPEVLPWTSRELNEEERKHSAAVQALATNEAMKEGKEHFGFEPVEDLQVEPAVEAAAIKKEKFQCPEHTETEWKCRYCLAAVIINGPLEPKLTLRRVVKKGAFQGAHLEPITELNHWLLRNDDQAPDVLEIEVLVARWSGRLHRDL